MTARRSISALMSTVIVTGTLTVASVVTAPAAHATLTALPYKILAANEDQVGVFTPADGMSQVLQHDQGSVNGVTVNLGGTSAWVDKGLYADLIHGGAVSDSKILPIDLGGGVINEAVHESCQRLNGTTISPDDSALAVVCSDDSTVLILNASDLSQRAIISGAPTTKNVVWSASGVLYLNTTAGLYAWSGGSLTGPLTPAGDAGYDMRVLPDGDLITVGESTSDDASILEIIHPTASGPYTVQHLSVSGTGGRQIFTTDPSGQDVWLQMGNGTVAKISLSSYTTVRTLPLLGTGDNLEQLEMDPSGTNLIAAIGRGGQDLRVAIVDLAGSGSQVVETFRLHDQNGGGGGRLGITPAPGPHAEFAWSGGLKGSANPLHFSASSSTSAPSTSIAKYSWDFGDGTVQTTTSPTIDHAYTQSAPEAGHPNGYTVTLTVTDSLGASWSTSSGTPVGSWDGIHWFTHGSADAAISHTVPVGSQTVLDISVDGLSTGTHVPLGTTISLTGQLSPYADYAAHPGGTNQSLYFTEDGTVLQSGTPVGTGSADNDTTVKAHLGPITLNATGAHTFSGYTNDDGLRSIQGANGNAIDIIVDKVATAVTSSTNGPELPAGSPVTVHAGIANCGGGSYAVVADGTIVKTVQTADTTVRSIDTTVTGLSAGPHQVHVIWTPEVSDDVCTGSTSHNTSVKLGTSATALALSGPSVAVRPGAQVLTTTLTSPDALPTTGTVVLKDGAAVVGAAALGAEGVNHFTVQLAAFGAHPLTATYTYPGSGWAPSGAVLGVLVDDVPSAPAVTSTSPKPGKLAIVLTPSDAHGSAVTSYVVICTSPKGPTGTVTTALTSLTVSGLRNNVDYVCVAQAHNAVGASPVSAARKGRPGKLPTVTLKATSTKVVKGHTITLSGTVTAADQPQTGRRVTITFRSKNGKKRTVVTHATTDKHGAFKVKVKVKGSGAFQASAPVGPATPTNKELFVTVGKGRRFV